MMFRPYVFPAIGTRPSRGRRSRGPSHQPVSDDGPRSAQISTAGPDQTAFDPAATGPGRERADDTAGESTEWQLRLLENLAEMAMVLVRGAFAQALEEQKLREEAARDAASPAAPEPAVPEPPPARPKPARTEPAEPRPPRQRGSSVRLDPRVMFLRLSREVRQILALHARLATAAPAKIAGAPVPGPNPADLERRKLVLRVLDEAMMFFGDALADHPDFDPEGFRSHCEERIGQEDMVDDLPWVPISSLVQRVAGEVDLPPDWRLWEDEDWAREEIRTKPPGSPYCFFPFTLEQEEAFDRVYVEQTGLPGDREPPNPRGYFARRRPP
jgi:hypothetical protein